MQNKPTFKIRYFFLSAATGAGKTQHIVDTSFLQNKHFRKNVLIIQTSRDLCNQTVTDFLRNHPAHASKRVETIHGTSKFHTEHSNSAVRAIIERVQEINATDPGYTLIITDAAFRMIPRALRITMFQKWMAFRDETFEPLSFGSMNFTSSLEEVQTRWLTFTREAETSDFGFCTTYPDRPRTVFDEDTLYGQMHSLCELIDNPDVELAFDWHQYEKLRDATMEERTKKSFNIEYSIKELPSLYDCFEKTASGATNLTFVSAEFSHSVLRAMWERAGVDWKETVTSLPRYMESHRVYLHYIVPDPAAKWSAAYRAKKHGDSTIGQTVVDIMSKRMRNQHKDETYVVLKNKNCELDYSRITGIMLPQVSHGLNKWRDHTVFMSTASFMASQNQERFYRRAGISIADIRAMRSTQIVLQAIARTNIRVRGSKKCVHVYLPTLNCCLEQARYLPEAIIMDVKQKTDMFGQMTGINARINPDWEALQTTDERSNSRPAYAPVTIAERGMSDRAVITLSELDPAVYPLKSTIDHMACHIAVNRKGAITAGLDAEGAAARKSTSAMMLPAVFRADAEGFLKDDVVGMSDFLLFDFDDSTASETLLEKLFDTYKFLKYSTISDNPRKKARNFRVILPLQRTLTINEHGKLTQFFVERAKRLEEKSSKTHGATTLGLDPSCTRYTQKQYQPHDAAKITEYTTGRSICNPNRILNSIVADAQLPSPTREDLIIISKTGEDDTEVKNTMGFRIDTERYNEALDIINTFGPGNRDEASLHVSSIGKKIRDHGLRRQLRDVFERAMSNGFDAVKRNNRLKFFDGIQSHGSARKFGERSTLPTTVGEDGFTL